MKAHICSNDENITTTRYSLEKKIRCIQIQSMVLNTSLKSVATLESPNIYVKSSKSVHSGISLQSNITHCFYSVILG